MTTWTPARILALRRTLGLTQEGLGLALRVHWITVLRWEHGHYRPSYLLGRRLTILAHQHGIAPAALPIDSNHSLTKS